MSKPKREARLGRGYWSKVVEAFETSGARRQGDFCTERGVKLAVFRQWLYRIRRERRAAGVKPTARFVELVARSGAGGGTVRFEQGGAVVTFTEVPPPGYLAELFRLMDR